MNTQKDPQFPQKGLPLETTPMTLEEFLESGIEESEYIEGKLVPMLPNSPEHGRVRVNLTLLLGLYIREYQLGRIYVPFTGLRVGECVLVPDIAFLLNKHIADDRSEIFPVPPDLAVEIVSPRDTSHQVEEKTFTYLEAGTQLVWVLKPLSKTVTVYRSEIDITLLTRDNTLTGENVIEGFSCQVAELFA